MNRYKSKEIPELPHLITKVEEHFGKRISSTSDFESLSVAIENTTGERISVSTLKRIWGYVSSNPTPRVYTMDILSSYIGCRDFGTFCKDAASNSCSDEFFFTSETSCFANDLNEGDTVTLGWGESSMAVLRYRGNRVFEITAQQNTLLLPGDLLESTYFAKGRPWHVCRILRNGTYTPSYVAGKKNGLTMVKIEKT